MTTSRLPEITVTCRTGHSFQTRAHGAQGVDCPQCRAGGNRVKVWVPKDRPRNARELAEREAIDAPAPAARAGAELAARWGSEQPWDGKLRLAAGRPADLCAECSGPISWEPGRTLVYCQACQRAGLPAAVTAHYARQEQRSTEIATRPAAPDSAALRAARVRLRALAQRMADTVNGWMDAFDPDGLSGHAERLALDYQAELTAYLPEIRQAGTEAELADIAAEITAITSRATSSGDIATIEARRAALERQREQAEREAQWAESARLQQLEQARAAERAELERQRQAAAISARPPKAIQGTVERGAGARTLTGRPAPGVAEGVAALYVMIERNRAAKAERLARTGTCGFQHRKPVAAERLYGISAADWQGTVTGTQLAGTAEVRACAKHFADADAWIETATVPRGGGICYWELTS